MFNQWFGLVFTIFNWTNFSQAFMEFWQHPYKLYLSDAFWPVVFTGVFGLSLMVSRGNLAVTGAAVLFTFGIFGSSEAFNSNPEFSMIFGIVAIACFAGSIAMLFTKKRYG